MRARWTALCLASVLACSCTKPASEPQFGPPALFRDATLETGLKFRHFTGATGQYLLPEIMGAGVALIDYDNDGDLDVYLIQGTTLTPGQPLPAGWKPGNRLFRNLLMETGKLQFIDVTESAGVGYVGYGMGVAVGRVSRLSPE